jgi:hypothetical protein
MSAPTRSRAGTVAPEYALAPYALVRLAAARYLAEPAGSTGFRQAMGRMVGLRARLDAIAPGLADALHDSAAGHPAEFHRAVVLPLRRDVFNGRVPRAQLLDDLGDLRQRVPALAAWLDGMTELARLRAVLADEIPAALGAERAGLADACRAEPLRRAATLTGADLLRGIDRAAAAGAQPDARARKGEPTVLRYALRSATKTSPLSWFTHVAWGRWAADGPDGDPLAWTDAAPTAVVEVHRTLLAKVTAELTRFAGPRSALRYRLAPGLRQDAGLVTFRRDIPTDAGDRLTAIREEEVALTATGPLTLLLHHVRAAGPDGLLLDTLTGAIAARMPGPVEDTRAAAARYVDRAVETRLIVAVEPVDPQSTAAPDALASWLAGHGEAELAGLLREIGESTARFGEVGADDRGAALARLRDRWQEVFTRTGVAWTDTPVLCEDVRLTEPVRLGRDHGRDSAGDLTRFSALVELFDFQVVLRRMIRDGFVARYGVGGRCDDVAEFSAEVSGGWSAAFDVSAAGALSPAGTYGPELRLLAEARAEVTALVRAAAEAGADEVRIPEEALRRAARLLPEWAVARPSSYAFFVQPAATAGPPPLMLNHVYAGWGKFTSRFLGQLPPAAATEIAGQVRAATGPDARVAQFRPVAGFNANLHPRFLDDEVSEDAAWGTIGADALGLRHDPATDQVRLYITATGQPIDLLYLGFLIPFALPDRLAPLYSDLGGGPVTFGHLVAEQDRDGVLYRPRLRYGDIVVLRRVWWLAADRTLALRAALDADADVPAETVARLRAELGLPAEVFIRAPGRSEFADARDLRDYLAAPKPQYVDLTNALHLRCLSRLLARHPDGIRIEEALPVPGRDSPGGRVTELVVETYRKGRAR